MATLRGVGSGVGGGLETNLFERCGQTDRQTDNGCLPHPLLYNFEPRLYLYNHILFCLLSPDVGYLVESKRRVNKRHVYYCTVGFPRNCVDTWIRFCSIVYVWLSLCRNLCKSVTDYPFYVAYLNVHVHIQYTHSFLYIISCNVRTLAPTRIQMYCTV